MRPRLCGALLLAGAVLGAQTATAKPLGCAVLTDPAGDVTAVAAGQPAAAVPDEHVDLRSVSLSPGRDVLTVTIRDQRLSPDRLGEWRVTFLSRGRRVFVGAASGVWVNVGTMTMAGTGFRAGVVGGRTARVDGMVDYTRGEIRIAAPLSAFGASAPRIGTAVSQFAVDATETLVTVGVAPGDTTTVTLADHASSAKTVVLGRAC